MAQTNYLDAEKIRLWRLEDGSLVMKHGERKTFLGPPRRALPLTNPDHWIVFGDLDGNEIGVLENVSDLESGSQNVLREALSREYTLERITRILEVEKEPLSGQTTWRVEIETPETFDLAQDEPNDAPAETVETSDEDGEEKTGRLAKVASFLSLSRDTTHSEDAISVVEREFIINSQDDVATARYPHIYIVDIERRRYEIVNCEQLDLESRKAADRFF